MSFDIEVQTTNIEILAHPSVSINAKTNRATQFYKKILAIINKEKP